MTWDRVIAFDTETALIRPGCLAPELACISFQILGQDPGLIWQGDEHAHAIIQDWLRDDRTLLVGHNVAFDTVVLARQWPDLLPLIFEKYDKNLITDTELRQKLLDIAGGEYRGRSTSDGRWIQHNYSLDALARRLLGRSLDKDTWRLQYGSLRDVPLLQWPAGARAYPLEDARATLDSFLSQEAHRDYIPSQYHEARAGFSQHLMSAWGLRTSPEGVKQLREATLAEIDKVKDQLVAEGLVRPDGTRDTKAAQARMIDVMKWSGRIDQMVVTPTGKPKLDGLSCKESEDPILIAYARYTTLNKVLGNDCEMLAQGIVVPIHPHYDLAESGRATCAGPNIQNLRRLPGVREAFVPRPGNVFIDADYPQLELWALGYVQRWLFGHSALADMLTTGRDPHTAFAAQLMGVSYEEGLRLHKAKDHAFEEARGTSGAKGANFGYPGGLGPEKFAKMAKMAGTPMPAAENRADDTITVRIRDKAGNVIGERVEYVPGYAASARLRNEWFKQWPEMKDYFDYISTLDGVAVLPSTGMIRGGAKFCALANTFFQGLGAAATKVAGWMLAKECYVTPSSCLYGSRPVAVIHDQYMVETADNDNAHDAAFRVAQIMEEGAEKVMPGCAPRPVEPVLSRYWSKEAKALFKNGRLVPWPEAA